MTPGRRALLGSALFTLCTAALADCRDKECELPASWNEFTAVTLTFSEGDSKGTTWSGVFDHETHDFLIDVQVREPVPMKGAVGMVGGRVMIRAVGRGGREGRLLTHNLHPSVGP